MPNIFGFKLNLQKVKRLRQTLAGADAVSRWESRKRAGLGAWCRGWPGLVLLLAACWKAAQVVRVGLCVKYVA